MNQLKLIFSQTAEILFGRKYYANIINVRGTARCEVSCLIFKTRKEADNHRISLDFNRSFAFTETVSFRSRKEY